MVKSKKNSGLVSDMIHSVSKASAYYGSWFLFTAVLKKNTKHVKSNFSLKATKLPAQYIGSFAGSTQSGVYVQLIQLTV